MRMGYDFMSMTVSLLKRADEAMLDMFKDIKVATDSGTTHVVPAIYANEAKALSRIFYEADKHLDDIKAFSQKIKLPLLALERVEFNFAGTDVEIGYKLNAYSMYNEDMNQIIEQVITKFKDENKPYKLKKINKADDDNPRTNSIKVCHWQFDLTLAGLGIGDK
jgi:hypothetical protein